MSAGYPSRSRTPSTRSRPTSRRPPRRGRRRSGRATTRCRSSSTATRGSTTRSRSASRVRGPELDAARGHHGRRQRRRRATAPRTRCGCCTPTGATTSRSPRAPPGRSLGTWCARRRSTARAGSATTVLEPAPATAARPEGAVELIARILARAARARRDRADRPADEHRAAAAAPPGARAADRAPVPHGRLDRRGQHDRLRRVQHLRRPRGRRHRVPVRPADHDDGPRRDPPGPAGPADRRALCGRWGPGPARDRRPSSPRSRWTATASGTARRRPPIHDAVAVAHLAIPRPRRRRGVPRRGRRHERRSRPRPTVCDGLPYGARGATAATSECRRSAIAIDRDAVRATAA